MEYPPTSMIGRAGELRRKLNLPEVVWQALRGRRRLAVEIDGQAMSIPTHIVTTNGGGVAEPARDQRPSHSGLGRAGRSADRS
jgi:hypothetical protein